MTRFPDHPSETARAIFCNLKAVLERQPWCLDACEAWPAPIANELSQLLRMLGDGTDAGGTLMQVRDVAEVLLKLLTVIATADLIAHGDLQERVLAKRALFSGRLSLGKWKAAFANFAKAPRQRLLMPELLDLAPANGRFCKAFDEYINYRNTDIGHGAYRPDSVELAERVELQMLGAFNRHGNTYSGGLDRAFAAVAEVGIWGQAVLHCDAPDGPLFAGAAGAKGYRQSPHAHHGPLRPLYLVRGDRALDLSPFLAGRICGECQNQDAFLFDSPKSEKPKDDPRFDFLDYCNGHRLVINARQSEEDLAELADIPFSDIKMQAQKLDSRGEFGSGEVVRLLDEIMFDSRFISPDWLRNGLRAHMLRDQKGIYWVQAPGHVGKTMFVRGLFGEGLDGYERKRQRNLLGDDCKLEIAPFFIKREYRFDLSQFASALENQVRGVMARSDTRLALVLPREGNAEQLQAGFVKFAEEARRGLAADRLIMAIDGLDELRDPEGGLSPLDYIPPAAALPENVTLLLTSRPPEDCPPWLRLWLKQDFAPGHDAHLVGLNDPGYIELLRTYIARHSGVTRADADFDEVCNLIIERSGSLFLIVSFLSDLIRDGASTGDEAAA